MAVPLSAYLQNAIEQRWYHRPGVLWLLWPLELLFRLVAYGRRVQLTRRQQHVGKPLAIVGNIAVGGTGKTPVIIALIKALQLRGLRVGVISRGYGRNRNEIARVEADSLAAHVGDEPLEIYRATGAPVVVAADRVAAARVLAEDPHCDILLADDGLQHYRLGRNCEIVVVDGRKKFGNGHCLPVGPLREPVSRLQQVDWILIQGRAVGIERALGFQVKPIALEHVRSGRTQPLAMLCNLKDCVSIAGIGDPGKFFNLLDELRAAYAPSLRITHKAFPDHHVYTPSDLDFCLERPVLMTRKDAVKCRSFARENWWALQVEAILPEAFVEALAAQLT